MTLCWPSHGSGCQHAQNDVSLVGLMYHWTHLSKWATYVETRYLLTELVAKNGQINNPYTTTRIDYMINNIMNVKGSPR